MAVTLTKPLALRIAQARGVMNARLDRYAIAHAAAFGAGAWFASPCRQITELRDSLSEAVADYVRLLTLGEAA